MDIKKATEVKAMYGETLESHVYKLEEAREKGENVFINFNETLLYSANVTMDNAYLAVTGMKKVDFEASQNKAMQEAKESSEKLAKTMNAKKSNFYARGEAIIAPEKKEEWRKCVDARIADLYHGMDLENALGIMEVLAKKDGTIDEACKIFDEADHSGMSASITTKIVFDFSERGKEFADKIYPPKEQVDENGEGK